MPAASIICVGMIGIICVGMIGVAEKEGLCDSRLCYFCNARVICAIESQFNQIFHAILERKSLKDSKFFGGPRVGAIVFEWLRRPDVGFRPHLALSLRLRFNG
jgi:hypothetical protein